MPKTVDIVRRASMPTFRAVSDGMRGQILLLGQAIHRHFGPQSTLVRTWLSARMVLWVATLLGFYLLFYYL
jgi:hypothetical protein